MCGDGGEDGMDIAKKIVDGYEKYLQPGGYAYMVLECIGDEERPYILDYFREKLKKGILNVSIINKNSLIFQAHASAKLASFSNNSLYPYYFEKWMELFNKQDATAIYPVTIEYINEDCEWRENVIRNYQEISLDSTYKLNEKVKFELENKPYYNVFKENQKRLSVRKDLLDYLVDHDGGKIIDIVKWDSANSMDYVCQLNEYLNTVITLQEQDLLQTVTDNREQPNS